MRQAYDYWQDQPGNTFQVGVMHEPKCRESKKKKEKKKEKRSFGVDNIELFYLIQQVIMKENFKENSLHASAVGAKCFAR